MSNSNSSIIKRLNYSLTVVTILINFSIFSQNVPNSEPQPNNETPSKLPAPNSKKNLPAPNQKPGDNDKETKRSGKHL
jgi:hypothetical protein